MSLKEFVVFDVIFIHVFPPSLVLSNVPLSPMINPLLSSIKKTLKKILFMYDLDDQNY